MNKKHIEIKYLSDCQEHISQLAKLQFEEISRHWIPNASIEWIEQRLPGHANKEKLPLTVVALHNNRPIGMASLRESDEIRPDLTPWLGGLVVNPEYRKYGVGKQLIDAIKKEASLKKYNKLYLFAFDPTIPTWYSRLLIIFRPIAKRFTNRHYQGLLECNRRKHIAFRLL